MTPREKRTVRYAAIGIAIYLVAFGSFQVWKVGSVKRAEYETLATQAADLKDEVKHYDTKIEVLKKLMENFHLDPAKLKRASVVAEASSAIQKAAQGGGFQLGPIRESPLHTAGKELATIQFEGSGPTKAAVGLLHRLETLGYPLVVDSAQFSSDPMRPGNLKLKLTIVVLDFDQWKKEKEEAPHA